MDKTVYSGGKSLFHDKFYIDKLSPNYSSYWEVQHELIYHTKQKRKAFSSKNRNKLKGEAKKTSLNSQHIFYLISLTKNMLEGWDIIHWKGGIHSFVWSTKPFLYNIWEPRYKQIKMGYRISKCLNIGQS